MITTAEPIIRVQDATPPDGVKYVQRVIITADGAEPIEREFDFGDGTGRAILKEKIERVYGRDSGVNARVSEVMERGWAAFKKDRGIPDEFTDDVLEGCLHTEVDETTRGDYVLVPGFHNTQYDGEIERGSHEFAAEVIGKLPENSLYRRDVIPIEIIGEAGAKHVRAVGCDDMRMVIDRNMRLGFWRRSGSGENEKYEVRFAPASRDHANIALALAAKSTRIPELITLTSYPIFVGHFDVCKPGFHEGVYYDEPKHLVGLRAERSEKVIRRTLTDLLVDFCFKAEADTQNYIGILVTVVARHVIQGNRPGHLIHAPLERSGKSKLAEMVGAICTGNRTPASSLPSDDAEMQKRLTAKNIASETLVHFDNLGEFIDLPSLASSLTAEYVNGRILGSSKEVRLRNSLVVILTGNNVRLSGELAKRMVPILLEPKTASPELRTDFQHPDLWGYVAAKRRLILSCILGMVMNWRDAGMPRGTTPMGGFEEWAAIVGGIMQHAGYDQWMTNATVWRGEADPVRDDLRAMVDAWVQCDGGTPRPKTVSELVTISVEKELFPAVTGGKEGKALATAFGMRVLARHTGTPVGEWVLTKNSVSRPAIYALRAIGSPDEAEVSE